MFLVSAVVLIFKKIADPEMLKVSLIVGNFTRYIACEVVLNTINLKEVSK